VPFLKASKKNDESFSRPPGLVAMSERAGASFPRRVVANALWRDRRRGVAKRGLVLAVKRGLAEWTH
jgi:hypothetical protein